MDIVPSLLSSIQRDFDITFKRNKKLKRIRKLVDGGKADYKIVNDYAIETGTILANVFSEHISSDDLPDGKMYYNIAERIVTPTLSNNYEIVSNISVEVQEQLNRSVGLNLKGVKPKVNEFRIESIINRIDAEDEFDNVAWILNEPVINFTQSAVDDTLKENINFLGKTGLSPRVIRTTHGADPCDWCKDMAGEYKYPDVPDGVYARHDRCRCTVEYDPGDARRQNVWTKEWR